jgi:serine/threonine-protein kinase ATR
MFETLPRAQWKDLAADSRTYAERFARAFGPSSASALVESVEIGNEPGKFSDADYRMVFENMARGFRAADPKLQIATCALTAGESHEYAKSVKCIAGLAELYDVLTVHSYPELEPWPTWRRSHPEDPRLKRFVADVTDLCRWRDRHAPGKPVWITEFGYDSSTKTPDPKTEFKQWEGVTDEQQAQWIVRSWLLFASLPVERAYLFFFNDSDEPQVHGASGLTRSFEPKPSFHAAAHLHRTLGSFRFDRNMEAGPARIAEFTQKSGSAEKIWAVWLPSGTGATAPVELPRYPGKLRKAERMPLRSGENVAVSIEGSALLASETPVYLFFGE